jgi:hypothetical protein
LGEPNGALSTGPKKVVDFNSDKMNLQVQNNGGEIKFHFDSALLQKPLKFCFGGSQNWAC